MVGSIAALVVRRELELLARVTPGSLLTPDDMRAELDALGAPLADVPQPLGPFLEVAPVAGHAGMFDVAVPLLPRDGGAPMELRLRLTESPGPSLVGQITGRSGTVEDLDANPGATGAGDVAWSDSSMGQKSPVAQEVAAASFGPP